MPKVFVVVLVALFLAHNVSGQGTLPTLDKSPMDMSYCPSNYPILKIQGKATEPPLARVVYSRPKKDNRAIFGGLVKYGEVWRLGANEATEIEFFKDVHINGKTIGRGRYTLYALVNENSWTFIINRDTDIWGAFKYDSKNDILRTDAPVQKLTDPIENLAIAFEKTADGYNLVAAWDTVKVALPITF